MKLSLLSLSLAFSTNLFAQSASLQDMISAIKEQQAITIYTAKEIITLDENNPKAEAIAVQGDLILAVGSKKELGKKYKDAKITLDKRFNDKVIVPGFIDQHVHPLLAALTMNIEIISMEDWVLPSGTVPAVRDRQGYIERLANAVNKDRSNKAFFTWGYHHYFHGKITRNDLDKISKTKPIVIWHRSAHEFVFNTAAMKKYGILDAKFKAGFNESALAMSNFDEGHFWEQGWFQVLPKVAVDLASPQRLKDGLEFAEQYFHTNGVTLVAEPGGLVSKPLQDVQNFILGDDDTPFKTYYIPDGKTMAQLHVDGNMIAETEKLLSWGDGKVEFLPKQVKLFADGAVFSQAMQMKDGYLDGHEGEWMIDLDIFEKAFAKYWQAGYQIHIHQNGDAGLEMVIDNIEKNMKSYPRKDHRTTIVHFAYSDSEQVKKLKQLGAIVSANPYYVTALADKYSEEGVGPERSQQMVRLGEVRDAGISYSFHSDMPMAPSQPLYLMWTAVNRTTFSGKVAGPNQRLTAYEALKAVTINAAYSLRLENQAGSLENGKLANLTILEKNPLTVDADKIKDIRVWGTMSEGRIFPISKKHTKASINKVNFKLDPNYQSDTLNVIAKSDFAHDNPMAKEVVLQWASALEQLAAQ